MDVRARISPLAAALLAGFAAVAGATAAAAREPSTTPELGLRDRTPSVLALENARIVVSPDRTLDRATLVVRDGRVEAVGLDVAVPPDARTLDLDGLTIFPGFVDPFTEYGLPPREERRREPEDRRSRAPQYEGHRVGPDDWNDAIHPEEDWVEAFVPDAKSAETWLARGVTVVQSGRRDGILRGRSFVTTLGPGLANDVVLRPASLQWASFDKGSSSQDYPSSLMGSIALLRQTLLDARWYTAAREAFDRDPSQPMPEVNLAIAAVAADPGPWLFETEDELSLLRAARIASEFGREMVWVGSNAEYRRLDEIAALGMPIVLPLAFPDKPAVGSFEDQLDVSLAELRLWERAPATAAALEKRGVPFAFTGSGLGPEDDAFAALRRALALGLSRRTALAALTTVPAELCGVGDRVGTLEPGRAAHFFVADGDPFADERARILSVWVSGNPAKEFVSIHQRDFRGTWAVELDGRALELRIGGKIDAPSGRIAAGKGGKETARLRGVRADLDRLTFHADLGKVGGEGVARFSVSDLDGVRSARVTTADGRRRTVALRRTGDAPRDEDEERSDDDGGDERAAEPDGTLVSRVTWPDSAFGLDARPAAEDVVVRHATVWTSGPAGVLEDADLLVVDGKIRAVGRDLDAPRGVRVIDGRGKHVTPGIIDEHSHIAISRGVNEGTHAVTAEVRIGDVVDSDDVAIWRALAGGVTVAQLLHGSANPIGGQAQVIKMRWSAPPEELKLDGAPPTIKFALGENVKQSNWGDRFTTRYPQTRMGVRTILEDGFLAARAYERAWDDWRALPEDERRRTVPPRRDLQLDALAEILHGQRFIHVHSYVQSEMLMLMRLAEQLGFRVQTFTHVLEGYKVAPEMAAHGATASSFSDWWAYKFEVYDAIPYNTCLLHDAGVVTSVNSDSADTIRRLNQEAGKSVMYCGLDEAEALKLVTLNPAIQLRIDDRVGSLEPGKDADFVVWSGPPLSMTSRAERTWVDGAEYFSLERDAELRRRAAEEERALVQKVLRTPGKDERQGRGGRRARIWHCDDVEDVWR